MTIDVSEKLIVSNNERLTTLSGSDSDGDMRQPKSDGCVVKQYTQLRPGPDSSIVGGSLAMNRALCERNGGH